MEKIEGVDYPVVKANSEGLFVFDSAENGAAFKTSYVTINTESTALEDGTKQEFGKVVIDGTLSASGTATVGDLTCQSMVMTNYVDMMQNYCDKGGVIMSNMGKYKCFRERGSAIMSETPVGGCVGALGYCVLSACNDTTTGKGILKLSGDVTPLKEITT